MAKCRICGKNYDTQETINWFGDLYWVSMYCSDACLDSALDNTRDDEEDRSWMHIGHKTMMRLQKEKSSLYRDATDMMEEQSTKPENAEFMKNCRTVGKMIKDAKSN